MLEHSAEVTSLDRIANKQGLALRLAVVSTPRSGNTWLRRMLAVLYGLHECAAHAPEEVEWGRLPARCVLQIHWHRSPAFVKLLEQHGFQVVVLARHPLDVLLSILHFAPHDPSTVHWLQGEGGHERCIYGSMPCSPSFLEYASGTRAAALLSVSREWWTAPGVQKVQYENLVAVPHDELRRLVLALDRETELSITEAVAVTTMANLRVITQAAHHFWQGRPGLWRHLLPAAEAHAIATAHQTIFMDLGYTCDPDPNLTRSRADANWVEMVGPELAAELQDLTPLKQKVSALEALLRKAEIHLAIAEEARLKLSAELAAAHTRLAS